MLTVLLVMYLGHAGVLAPGCFAPWQEALVWAAMTAETALELAFVFRKDKANARKPEGIMKA